MPTYALLGATGSTGSAIIRCLLAEPPHDLSLNLLVRSKSRLLEKIPDLERSSAFDATIIEGTPQDSSALQNCLDNADVVFNCIGTNEPRAGTTLIYDTTTAILAALQHHQQAKRTAYKTPTILQLRSSSLNPQAALPWIARNMAWFLFYHIYADLDRACKLLAESSTAADGTEILHYIFIDPPSIHDADGTVRTGYKVFVDATKEKQESAISYADLGASFCEVAARKEQFKSDGVLVSATGDVNMTWGPLLGYMRQGLVSRIWA